MTIANRLYLVLGLVAILAIAASAITLTSHLSSAQSPDATPDSSICAEENEADEADEADDVDDADDACDDLDEGADDDADDVQEPKLNGSIAIDESQFEDVTEEEESAALAPLAVITAADAATAAQTEVPGDVSNVELDNENGSLVYSVDIGGNDVKVDAGTGAVLHVDADGPED